MRKALIAFLVLAAGMVACQKSADVTQSVPDPSRPVKFSVTNLISLETKADAIATGKYVAVYAGAPISKDNVQMTVTMSDATSGTLEPTVTNSILWAVGQTTAATNFLAVYPYETTRPLLGDTEATKYIEYSITDAASVEYADKFLAAAASQAPGTDATPATVALAFKHPFAKLIYNIDNQSDDFVSGVKISGIRRDGNLMFATGAVTTTGDAVAADAAVALNENGTNSWYTVVMPEATAVNPIVTVEMVSGAKYVFRLSTASVLEAGKQYTADIEITGSHGDVSSDRTVLGTFTVTEWVNVDAGDLTQDSSTPAAKWWYLSGNVDKVDATGDSNWAAILPFKCTGVDTWQIDFYYAGGVEEASNGFKLRYATDIADWTESYGMSPSNKWVIAAAEVKAEGAGDDYLVHSLTSEGGINIRIDTAGKYRIVFHPSESKFYIYTLD